MPDYKQMYLDLLDATEKAINELISAQRACEERYILSSEEEEKDCLNRINEYIEKTTVEGLYTLKSIYDLIHRRKIYHWKIAPRI